MIESDEIPTLFSGVALVVSLVSIWLARRTWLQSNRPIVSAAVRTHISGNEQIDYDLAVINSGTRPALSVRLAADEASVRAAMRPEADETLASDALRCFGDDGSVIPLLLNGETSVNSFGTTSGGKGAVWEYGRSFVCRIQYQDLEGRSYRSQVSLVIKDSAGFAGGSWK